MKTNKKILFPLLMVLFCFQPAYGDPFLRIAQCVGVEPETNVIIKHVTKAEMIRLAGPGRLAIHRVSCPIRWEADDDNPVVYENCDFTYETTEQRIYYTGYTMEDTIYQLEHELLHNYLFKMRGVLDKQHRTLYWKLCL